MRQLNGIDASFLNMETSTNFGHISSVSLYDTQGVPGGAGLEATKALILERIDQLAPFRRRLVQVPLGLVEVVRTGLAAIARGPEGM